MRAVLLLVVALGGCIAPPLDPASAAEPSSARGFALSEPVAVLGTRTVEPGIAVAPDGRVYVVGYSFTAAGGPVAWRSGDDGVTWERVDVGAPADGAHGNSDVDVAVAPDGTVYIAAMTWMTVGLAISVGASEDAGESWTWKAVTVDPWADRPFLAVGADNVAHVVWSNARGLHHASSSDRGQSWTEGALAHPTGGTGRIAIAPDGTLAVRVMQLSGPTIAPAALPPPVFGVAYFVGNDPAADGVSISTDGGASWTFRDIPGNRTPFDRAYQGGDGTFRWAESVTFDADGVLHAGWTEEDRLHLARSRDLGKTWEHRAVAADPEALAYFPTLLAGPGRLGATWYTYAEEKTRANVALVRWPAGAQPSLDRAAYDVEAEGGEYFPLAFLADGRLVTANFLPGSTADAAGFEWRREIR